MILLNDILKIDEKDLSNTKIRFNQINKETNFNPIVLFKTKDKYLYNGNFRNYGKNKVFKEGQVVIGFIRIKQNEPFYLLFDISIITKDLDVLNGVGYKYKTLDEFKKYYGRIIIKFENKSQNLIRYANTIIDKLEVVKIIEDVFDDDIFPGYENINLSWNDLKRIVDKEAWKTALQNQKGVYLITDILNGKLYVGSAYGNEMILGRWKCYIKNGHGGNKDLKNLDFEYIKKNFRYSVLDIYKSTIDDKVIIEREQWWKEVLKSRDFGYNMN